MSSYFRVHCFDCGEHPELSHKLDQPQCSCGSIDYKSVDAMEQGECSECDDCYEGNNT